MRLQSYVYRTLSIVFILFFNLSQTDAKIPFGQIKGLGSILKPEYQYLCPLYGALLWETGYVKNLYRFGWGPTKLKSSYDYEPSTKLLLKLLFFLQNDGVTFAATSNPLHATAHLNVEKISQIITSLENYTLTYNKEELKNKIESIFEPIFVKKDITEKRKQSLTSTIESIKKEIQKLETRKNKGIEKKIDDKKKSLETFKTEYENTISVIEEHLSTPVQKTVHDFIDNLIKRYEQTNNTEALKKQKSLRNNFAFQVKMIHDNINMLIDSLCAAINEEENKIYPLNHTIAILLSLLWIKAENKHDFVNYFSTLSDILGVEKHFTQDMRDFATNENKIKNFESDNYNATDYDNLFITNATQTKTDDIETLTFFYLGYISFKSPLPSTIEMHKHVRYKNLEFSDCGEQTLLSLFIALFYDAKEMSINLDLLIQLYKTLGIDIEKDIANLQPEYHAAKRLFEFFKEHKTAEQLTDSQMLHEAWATVVSDLKNVIYNDGNPPCCNIRAGINNDGINNMLNVLNNLLPGIKSFEGLTNALKKVGIELSVDNENSSDGNDTIELQITKQNSDPFTLTWKFQPHHFTLPFPDLSQNYPPEYKTRLEEIISQLTQDSEKSKLAIYTTLAGALKIDIENINDQKFNQYHFLMQPLTSEKITDSFEMIIKYWPNEALPQMISNFYNGIATDIELEQEVFISCVIEQAHDPKNNIWITLKNKLSDIGKCAFCLAILNDSTRYSNWIDEFKTILPTISDSQVQENLITSALKVDTSSYMDNMDLLTYVFQWIESTLPKITDPNIQKSLIKAIIKMNPSDYLDKPNLLAPLFKWIKETLANISDPQIQKNIIISILKKSSEKYQEYKDLHKYLIDGVLESLGKISNIQTQKDLIDCILKIEPASYKENVTLLTPIFKWVEITLQTISDQQIKKDLIISILKIKQNEYIKNMDLIIPLFKWIEATLPTISDAQQTQKDLIGVVLYYINPIKCKTPDIIIPLHNWVNETLPTILDTGMQKDLIVEMLNTITPANYKDHKTLLIQLYKSIQTTISNMDKETRKELISKIQNSVHRELKPMIMDLPD